MKKIWILSALLVGVLNFFILVPRAMALSEEIYPPPMPEESFHVVQRRDPLTGIYFLDYIEYYVSSTGATSGVRYRTTMYYIVLHNPDGSSATFSFSPYVSPPPPGQTVISKFTVTAQDLLDAGFTPDSLKVSNFDNITRGADIDIYNANTGVIYRTIYNPPPDVRNPTEIVYPQLDQLGPDFGFGSTDIADMKTRYADKLIPGAEQSPDSSPWETCSLEQGTIDFEERVSGTWSEPYYSWVTHSSTSCSTDENGVETCSTDYWSTCDITGSISGNYWERLEVEISQPDFPTVKAGQGTSVVVTTRYANSDPSAWNGSSYTKGISSVKVQGPDTEDWQRYKTYGDQITEDMVLQSTNIYYEYLHPESHSTGCNGGSVNVGYNVPVVEQTWLIPYARFDDVTGWTRHQTPPTDIDNRYVFGGLNRWYFGFDIPDGQTFDLRFMAQGGVSNNLTVCKGTTITIQGGAYDDVIVRTVDPENPFPGGVPANWKGKEHYITDLIDWFKASEIAYQRKVAAWRQGATLRGAYEYISSHLIEGIHRLLGSQDVGW